MNAEMCSLNMISLMPPSDYTDDLAIDLSQPVAPSISSDPNQALSER